MSALETIRALVADHDAQDPLRREPHVTVSFDVLRELLQVLDDSRSNELAALRSLRDERDCRQRSDRLARELADERVKLEIALRVVRGDLEAAEEEAECWSAENSKKDRELAQVEVELSRLREENKPLRRDETRLDWLNQNAGRLEHVDAGDDACEHWLIWIECHNEDNPVGMGEDLREAIEDMRRTEQVKLRLKPEVVATLDEARGELGRSAWVSGLIVDAYNKKLQGKLRRKGS